MISKLSFFKADTDPWFFFYLKMAQTERDTEDMSKNWDDRVAESNQDAKV